MVDSYYGWTFSAQVGNNMFIISATKLNCYLGVSDRIYLWIISGAEIKKMVQYVSNGGSSQMREFINTVTYLFTDFPFLINETRLRTSLPVRVCVLMFHFLKRLRDIYITLYVLFCLYVKQFYAFTFRGRKFLRCT